MSRFTPGIVLMCALILVSLPGGCDSPAPLRVGTMPVIDSLPLSLARHKPIFHENNLAMETSYFNTPAELRDALVSETVDAVITDLLSALLINNARQGCRIVRIALKPSASHPMFAIMTGSVESIRLENARIAVPAEAMDRYVAERLLSSTGVSRWTEVEVSSQERGLEMMRRGEVTAALLSEPQISIALRDGASIVSDDRSLMPGQTVIVFSQRMVSEKPAIIRRFLRAYEQAIRELDVRPDLYRFLVVELVRATPEVVASMPIPVFPFPGDVPTESDVESASAWLVGKKMSQPVPYSRVVNAGFLWDPYQFRPAACCGW